MTTDDRDLLLSLRQQHSDLRQMLERLTSQLASLEARTSRPAAELNLPPIPPEAFLPPVPVAVEALPPLPALASLPPIPAAPAAGVSMEFRFGRWLMRLSLGLLLLGLVFLAGWAIHEPIGAAGKLSVFGFAGVAAMIAGQRLEKRGGGTFYAGRLLLVAGLAGLYFTFYAAQFVDGLRVLPAAVLGDLLLILWSLYVLLLAERRQSQPLAVLGLALGYVSTALSVSGRFGMGADLVLTATAAAFLLRHGWTTLAVFSAVGTYFALFRRLVFDNTGDLVLDTSRTLPFLPHAVYLAGAWAILTWAIILTTSPTFRGAKRMFLVSLNNVGLVFLLMLTAYIAGYGARGIGWTLLDSGVAFLIASRLAGFAENDAVDLMAAYAAQGLAAFTAGIIVVYTGLTRAFALLAETLLLGVAGAFAGDRILTVSTYVAGFFATIFSVWQVGFYAHHPWLLGLGGALIMLINAWTARGEVRHSPAARSSTVVSTACFCLLALALIFTALSSELTDASLPVALALAAVVLTFAIYQFSIFELPAVAQFLMGAALLLVLFPIETGEDLPGWTVGGVALSTLVLVTWWARQRVTVPGAWVRPVMGLYALALVYLAVLAARPYLDAQNWMVAESLLSVVFLVYGAMFRVWAVALAGQVLLFLSLYHFFFPPRTVDFSWAWWAAAIPVVVTVATARALQGWLPVAPGLTTAQRATLSLGANLYKLVALAGAIRWIFGLVPLGDQMSAFLLLGTFLLSVNIRHPDSFGIRCGLLLSALGMLLCLGHTGPIATYLNGFAVLLLVAQVPLLTGDAARLVTRVEDGVLVLAAAVTSWYFVSVWTWPMGGARVTLAWSLVALFLFVFGLASRVQRLRWCGLTILFAAILRAFCIDLWNLPSGMRVLTFFLLSLITLAVGLSLLWLGARRVTLPPMPQETCE